MPGPAPRAGQQHPSRAGHGAPRPALLQTVVLPVACTTPNNTQTYGIASSAPLQAPRLVWNESKSSDEDDASSGLLPFLDVARPSNVCCHRSAHRNTHTHSAHRRTAHAQQSCLLQQRMDPTLVSASGPVSMEDSSQNILVAGLWRSAVGFGDRGQHWGTSTQQSVIMGQTPDCDHGSNTTRHQSVIIGQTPDCDHGPNTRRHQSVITFVLFY